MVVVVHHAAAAKMTEAAIPVPPSGTGAAFCSGLVRDYNVGYFCGGSNCFPRKGARRRSSNGGAAGDIVRPSFFSSVLPPSLALLKYLFSTFLMPGMCNAHTMFYFAFLMIFSFSSPSQG